MSPGPLEPLRIADDIWRREEIGRALRVRDIGLLFRLVSKFVGASQTQIGIATGMDQATVCRIMKGSRLVTAMDVLERIASGLHMPDKARMRMGLAPRDTFGEDLHPSGRVPATSTREEATNRRDLTRALAAALATAAASPLDAVERITSGLAAQKVDRGLVKAQRQLADAFAGLYRGADPRAALPVVAAQADGVLELLDAANSEADARELAAVAVDLHAQVGLWACHLHRRPLAYRHLATACDVAAGTGDQLMHARALGALAYLFSSAPRGGRGGSPSRALSLLTQALGLAGPGDTFTAGWLATWRADQLATLGRIDDAQRDIELAEKYLDVGEDRIEGFFSRLTYGYGIREHLDSIRAVVCDVVGRRIEADAIFADVQVKAANIRRKAATLGHRAFASVQVKEPDAACEALSSAVELSSAGHYTMGLRRVVGVRASFDPNWTDLPYVCELDERLRQLGL